MGWWGFCFETGGRGGTLTLIGGVGSFAQRHLLLPASLLPPTQLNQLPSPLSPPVLSCGLHTEAEHRSTFYIPYWNVPLLRVLVPRQRQFAADIRVINDCLDELITRARASSVQQDEESLQARDYTQVGRGCVWWCVVGGGEGGRRCEAWGRWGGEKRGECLCVCVGRGGRCEAWWGGVRGVAAWGLFPVGRVSGCVLLRV